MPRLLFHNTTDPVPEALLRVLAADGVDFSYTTDRELFEAALQQRGHDVCLVRVGAEPTPELVAALSKARSLHQLRGVVGVTTGATPDGLRTLLKLGVKEVFLEPVAPQRVARVVRQRLHQLPGGGGVGGVLEDVTPLAGELHAFGRVGRVARSRPGEILVETDLDFAVDEEIELVNEVPAWFGLRRARFRVLRREERDLYYAYARGWWLGAVDPRVCALWPAVVDRITPRAVRPKPKVAWIGERRVTEVERLLSPAVVSLHPVRPSQLDDRLLTRLDPVVVVVDDPSPAVGERLRRWGEGRALRIVCTAAVPEAPWPRVDLDPAAFPTSWAAAVGPPPEARDPDVLYPNRADPASRCTFVVPATLRALSTGGFEVSTVARAPEGCLVELIGAPASPRTTLGWYGRVVDARPDDGGAPGRLRCETVPVTDDPYFSLLRVTPEPRPDAPSAPQRARPHAEPVPRAAWLFAAVLVGGFLALGALALTQAPPPTPGEPASTEDVLAAIRKAFD